MSTCSIRWRSSGGRGEWEYVPSDSLTDHLIEVSFDPLGLTIPAEVVARNAQGKPRLRKLEKDNRNKLHLPALVMAVCRLPEPRRQDVDHAAHFPLRDKSFLIDAMEFDIVDMNAGVATLAPLRVSIMHSEYVINLEDRLAAVARDVSDLPNIEEAHPDLAAAIREHHDEVMKGVNSAAIRAVATKFNTESAKAFGDTNAGSADEVLKYQKLPESEIEEAITGTEGRILTRIHSYRERDRTFVAKVKRHYKKAHGKIICEGCGLDPSEKYGADGERCIEAHHRIPIQELQPDSITREEDIALICASCHRIVHTRYPCLTIDELKALLGQLDPNQS